MTKQELEQLAERVWDVNIAPDINHLTIALSELRSALHKTIRHLAREEEQTT